MTETIDIGTVSARGQIAIPADIREKMRLKEGEKVLFLLEGDSLLLKKVRNVAWDELTKPLRKAAQRAELHESDVPALVEKVRRKK